MTSCRTGRRRASQIFAVLLGITFTLAFAATVSAQVVSDPRIAEFDPSPDHWTLLDNGQPAVLRYELGVYVVGASAPFTTVDMGMPSPDADGKIRYDFATGVTGWPLPGGNYEARVSAVGPEGEALSEPSNPFVFGPANPCTITLSATTVSVPASGSSYTVYVSTDAGCGWTVTTAVSWVNMSTAEGSGSAAVPFDVAANSSTAGRAGTITIGEQVLTLSQDGAPAPKTTPTVTWATPASITQGTPLSSAQLNAAASVPGTFTYTPAAGTVLAAGTHTLTAAFTPADTTRYTTATASRSITVTSAPKTTPTVTWATPASITQGTPLSSAQLNATASVPGTFTYTPAAGTVLAAGTHTLTAAFTPADTTRYTTATASRSLTVNPITYQLTISRPTGGTVYGAGIDCGTTGTTCQVIMSASMTLGLQAKPDAGYVFSGWTGACSGTSPSCSLQLNGSKSCGATFTALPASTGTSTTTSTTGGPSVPSPDNNSVLPVGRPYTLTIVQPSGGVVRAAGINCGTTSRPCTVTMPVPMTVGLQAAADRGYVFLAWTGHCSGSRPSYALALEGPRTCGASFIPAGSTVVGPVPTTPTTGDALPKGAPYRLTVTRPTGGIIQAAGIYCGTKGGTCSVTMPASLWLGLQATPDPGRTFTGWTGNCGGSQRWYFLALAGPRTCGATFAASN